MQIYERELVMSYRAPDACFLTPRHHVVTIFINLLLKAGFG